MRWQRQDQQLSGRGGDRAKCCRKSPRYGFPGHQALAHSTWRNSQHRSVLDQHSLRGKIPAPTHQSGSAGDHASIRGLRTRRSDFCGSALTQSIVRHYTQKHICCLHRCRHRFSPRVVLTARLCDVQCGASFLPGRFTGAPFSLSAALGLMDWVPSRSVLHPMPGVVGRRKTMPSCVTGSWSAWRVGGSWTFARSGQHLWLGIPKGSRQKAAPHAVKASHSQNSCRGTMDTGADTQYDRVL